MFLAADYALMAHNARRLEREHRARARHHRFLATAWPKEYGYYASTADAAEREAEIYAAEAERWERDAPRSGLPR